MEFHKLIAHWISLTFIVLLYNSCDAGLTPKSNLSQFSNEGVQTAAVSALKAFPTAEGFGAYAVGGRGGDVYEITNLNDSGAGSFRACVEASNPRTCVFRTGGTIVLQSGITVRNPYLTVAGQTAPGDGITLRAGSSMSGPLFSISADHVIVRHMRFRRGATGAGSCCDDTVVIADTEGVSDVIFDHVSFSWGVDETLSTWYAAKNITIQWSMITEALRCANDPNGCRSAGFLIGSQGSERISVHHNLFAHNHQRNPAVNPSGVVDVVNNIIYNYSLWPTHVNATDTSVVAPMNYVGNYGIPGEATSGRLDLYMLHVSDYSGNGDNV